MHALHDFRGEGVQHLRALEPPVDTRRVFHVVQPAHLDFDGLVVEAHKVKPPVADVGLGWEGDVAGVPQERLGVVELGFVSVKGKAKGRCVFLKFLTRGKLGKAGSLGPQVHVEDNIVLQNAGRVAEARKNKLDDLLGEGTHTDHLREGELIRRVVDVVAPAHFHTQGLVLEALHVEPPVVAVRDGRERDIRLPEERMVVKGGGVDLKVEARILDVRLDVFARQQVGERRSGTRAHVRVEHGLVLNDRNLHFLEAERARWRTLWQMGSDAFMRIPTQSRPCASF